MANVAYYVFQIHDCAVVCDHEQILLALGRRDLGNGQDLGLTRCDNWLYDYVD